MLRDRIRDLFKDEDPDVQNVIERVIEEEWANLSYQRPPRILEEIKGIVESEVKSHEA